MNKFEKYVFKNYISTYILSFIIITLGFFLLLLLFLSSVRGWTKFYQNIIFIELQDVRFLWNRRFITHNKSKLYNERLHIFSYRRIALILVNVFTETKFIQRSFYFSLSIFAFCLFKLVTQKTHVLKPANFTFCQLHLPLPSFDNTPMQPKYNSTCTSTGVTNQLGSRVFLSSIKFVN